MRRETDERPPRLTRRRVLQLGATLGLGGVAAWRGCGYPEPPGAAKLRALGRRGAAISLALAEAALPSSWFGPDRHAPLLARLDRYLAALPVGTRSESRAALQALEHTTLWFGGRLRRFTRLGLADRRRVLHGWERSRLLLARRALRGLLALVFLAHYADADAFARIGYGGPVTPPGWAGPPEAAARYAALRADTGQLPPGARRTEPQR